MVSRSERVDEPIVTREEIEAGLRHLGLGPGAVVEVHSSLSAFGRVEGGAGAVVDALMNVVGRGTIVMSAYRVSPAVPLTEEEIARGITWKVRVLPEGSPEKTGLGAVVEEFKRRPGVVCGAEMLRTCAWGHQADRHRNGYEYLLEIDGWALLLGLGIGSCSSMHEAERVPLPEAIESCFSIPEELRRDYDPKSWGIGYGGTPDDAWGTVYTEADRRGLVRRHTIGRATCHLFRARAAVGIYEE
jgi:aminoglycoside N3'-acetyltransferase